MSISIRKLNKVYPNGNHALKDVCLEIPTGMFGLLGPKMCIRDSSPPVHFGDRIPSDWIYSRCRDYLSSGFGSQYRTPPYIYFTTPAETHIFEIFAVVYCESETTPVPYHYAEYSDEQFDVLIADMKARSQYTYDVDVTPEDRIITLSTCSYKYGTYSQNPNQRYIVLGLSLIHI